MKKQEHIINIGGCHASRDPVIIRTLLGSCVAVCLFDPHRRVGGMNHILLPGKASLKDVNAPTRYAVNSMEILINKILARGGMKKALTAKVFGGANIMPGISGPLAAGPKIVSFVREFLAFESIAILKEDTGGSDTRTIYFHTDNGDVYLRRTASTMTERLALQEKKALQNLKKEIEKVSEIEWFK